MGESRLRLREEDICLCKGIPFLMMDSVCMSNRCVCNGDRTKSVIWIIRIAIAIPFLKSSERSVMIHRVSFTISFNDTTQILIT